MKNVCFFNTIDFWGGGEKLHLEYAMTFKEKGYTIFMLTKEGSPLDLAAKENEINCHNISIKNLSFLNPGKYKQVENFFRDEKIDTVFFSTSQDVKVGSFAAKKAGVQRIIYLRGLAKSIKKTWLNKKILEDNISHIVANSEETRKMVIGNFTEAKIREKAIVIYHGIDLEHYDYSASVQKPVFQKKEDGITIGSAGRLTEQKGQVLLIDAVNILLNKGYKLNLVLAGVGPLEEQIKSRVNELGINTHVQFLGFVSEIESFMKDLDFFVLPSLWEGFGYAIVEAMAAKKAVVAFNLSSNPEIIADNVTGFLADEPNAEKLAATMEKLILDPEIRVELGKMGRKRVEEKFQLKSVIEQLEKHLIYNG